jgi:tetratricopeptide (TPR) repeat protein
MLVAAIAVGPDRYRPALATALSNLGNWYSEVGRPAEALPITQEAVAVYRELAAASPDRFRPRLANALNNLGNRYSEAGRPADAAESRAEVSRLRDTAS